MREKTEQELFWEGEFGDSYTERNQYDPMLRVPQYRHILSKTQGVESICEFGANRGLNMKAWHAVDPQLRLTAVEINSSAFAELSKIPYATSIQSPIQDYAPQEQYDLTFTCGVLIHINPDTLGTVYQRLYDASRGYVMMIEYFNPTPVEIDYRGHAGRLFKRDFAGEFIDQFGAGRVSVVDYGFWWRRAEPQWDNATWTLMRKAP